MIRLIKYSLTHSKIIFYILGIYINRYQITWIILINIYSLKKIIAVIYIGKTTHKVFWITVFIILIYEINKKII